MAKQIPVIAHNPTTVVELRLAIATIAARDQTLTEEGAAVYAAMGELLGGVHEKSYVLVADVKGAAYGFGGITQEERYIFGKPASIARRLRAAG